MNEIPGLEKPRERGKFARSVEQFIASAPWLTPLEHPSVAALEALAEQLDGGARSPALFSQFGSIHRSLLKRDPRGAASPDDDLDELIDQVRNG